MVNMAKYDLQGELESWIREEESDYVKGFVQQTLENWAVVKDALNDYNEADVFLNLKDEFKKQLESFLECQREVDGKLRERVGLIKNNGLSADQNLLKAARMETIKGKIKQKIKTHVNKLRAQGPGEGKCCQN